MAGAELVSVVTPVSIVFWYGAAIWLVGDLFRSLISSMSCALYCIAARLVLFCAPVFSVAGFVKNRKPVNLAGSTDPPVTFDYPIIRGLFQS